MIRNIAIKAAKSILNRLEDKTPSTKEDHPEKVAVKVVISGAPFEIFIWEYEKISDLIRTALKRAGVPHGDVAFWQLRSSDGQLLAETTKIDGGANTRIGESEIKAGETLFLDPEAGGGGNVKDSPPERKERILVVESSSAEFGDVAKIVGGSIRIADADLVLVVSGDDQGQAIKHRDRLPEEVDVEFARRPLAERLGDSPEQRIMDES